MCLCRWCADNAAQISDPHLLLLDLLSALSLLNDLLDQLLLIYVVNVHSSKEVFFLVGFPEHVQLLLRVNILLQHVSHLYHLVLTLPQPSVIVLNLLPVFVLDFLEVAADCLIALVVVVLELLDASIIGLFLRL